MSLTSGTRFGPYEIVAPLGAGGMGEVYRARDPKLDRDVALKILPGSFANDPDPSAGSGSPRAASRGDRLMRFEREAKTLAETGQTLQPAPHRRRTRETPVPRTAGALAVGSRSHAVAECLEVIDDDATEDVPIGGARPVRVAAGESRSRAVPSYRDDVNQMLESCEVCGIAGVEAGTMGVRRRSNQQVYHSRARLAPGAGHDRGELAARPAVIARWRARPSGDRMRPPSRAGVS